MSHEQHHTTRNTKASALPIIAIAVTLAALFAALPARAESYLDPPWGYDTVAGRCVVCHSLEEGGPFRVAPNLFGIVGAEKARARAWYAYSPALIEMGGTWTVEDLDAFLADANAFVPGTKKTIQVTDPDERAAIIAFLQTLHD